MEPTTALKVTASLQHSSKKVIQYITCIFRKTKPFTYLFVHFVCHWLIGFKCLNILHAEFLLFLLLCTYPLHLFYIAY